MLALEPHPPADTRFFFSMLPANAGFQMGNGALIRALYREPKIESYYLSQFADSIGASGDPGLEHLRKLLLISEAA